MDCCRGFGVMQNLLEQHTIKSGIIYTESNIHNAQKINDTNQDARSGDVN